MLDWLLRRVHDAEHGSSTLRTYLWWGIVIRGALLFAMLTLLIVEGNFLAEWLLTLQVPLVPEVGLEELTAFSYVVIFLLLSLGSLARWGLLRRLNAVAPDSPEEAKPSNKARPDKEGSSKETGAEENPSGETSSGGR